MFSHGHDGSVMLRLFDRCRQMPSHAAAVRKPVALSASNRLLPARGPPIEVLRGVKEARECGEQCGGGAGVVAALPPSFAHAPGARLAAAAMSLPLFR